MSVDHKTRPPFNDATRTVEVTRQEMIVGTLTHKVFESRLRRTTPWLIKNGVFRYSGRNPEESAIEHIPGMPMVPKLEKMQIRGEDITKEKPPEELLWLVDDFLGVEQKLPDFSGRAQDMYRNYRGIRTSYGQWDYEEGQHGQGLTEVLKAQGYKTEAELQKDYFDRLAQTWEMPFRTPRQMTIYAMLQEARTKGFYLQLREIAVDSGAFNIAQVLSLIAKDEAYHSGGYTKFAQAFAEEDLEGTINDTMYVTENFRMPAQNLLANPRKSLRNLRQHKKLLSREDEAREYLVPTLLNAKYVPEEQVREAAAKYVANTNFGKLIVPGNTLSGAKLVGPDGRTPLV